MYYLYCLGKYKLVLFKIILNFVIFCRDFYSYRVFNLIVKDLID